jgi:hypothetical protein
MAAFLLVYTFTYNLRNDMAENAVGKLRVNLTNTPDLRSGWCRSSEISIRDDGQTAFNSIGYAADSQAAIDVGRHEPGGEQGIRWSTPLDHIGFVPKLIEALGSVPYASPIEVWASNAVRREAYTATGVFFELADYLEDEIGDDVVEAIHLSLGDQLIRWSDNPGHFLPRIEVRAERVDSSIAMLLLGATACNSLTPQFETAINSIATV